MSSFFKPLCNSLPVTYTTRHPTKNVSWTSVNLRPIDSTQVGAANQPDANLALRAQVPDDDLLKVMPEPNMDVPRTKPVQPIDHGLASRCVRYVISRAVEY